ncbi:peroxidase-related enzyme [Paracoccaceae bacterium]|nr:peroxidase-related enzyme [Paracoccaceae bacterium]MDA9122343.1 peroxidase-related enzyme [Paracoccaceae bacterium]|tara:strand:- start:4 stop:579 length:576 start_codon:yes stop_codon:yes gene_type:complete
MNKPSKQVTALNLPEMDPMPDNIRKYFKLCEDKLGLVPNVLKAYAFNETKLNAFTGMYNDLMLGESNITPLEREMIAVVVSSINRCYYCLVAHGNSVRKLSKNPELGEQMAINYRLADLKPNQRAMMDFAVKMTEESYKIEEIDRQTLRDNGYSDQDIWDIASIASFFNMSNRMASAIDMRPNVEYHSLDR